MVEQGVIIIRTARDSLLED